VEVSFVIDDGSASAILHIDNVDIFWQLLGLSARFSFCPRRNNIRLDISMLMFLLLFT